MLGLAAITIYNLIKPIDVGAVEAFAWMDSLAIGFITPKFLAIILAAIKPTAVWREQSSKPSATQAKTAAQPSQD